MKYIIFSYDGIGFPVAKRLIEEGADVTVVQVEDKADLGMKGKEDPESKRRRMSLYDGVFKKWTLGDALKIMKTLPQKEDYFVWFDFNHLWKVSEQVEAMGFTKGLFVRKEDLTYEDDRQKAKELVEAEYDGVKVGESHEFTKIKDGVEFLNETEDVWVLKGNDEDAKTKVPSTDDPEKAKKILIDLMEAHSADYEKGGYILEKKIINGYEATPQIVFYDGKPVYASLDIENKPKAAGNEGIQLGCAQNLIVKIELDDKISEIAFPEYVYKQAAKRKGIYVWDCGLIFKNGEFYFTEFCAQRFGYDSFFTELAMAGSVTRYFEQVVQGKNPLIYQFGAAARGLNEHKDGEMRRVLEDLPMMWDPDKNDDVWVYELKHDEEGDYVCTGTDWDLVVFTGAGETIESAVFKCYRARESFVFEDMAVRPMFDFMSRDYQSSIPNRFNMLNHAFFEAPDMIETEHTLYEMKLNEVKTKLGA